MLWYSCIIHIDLYNQSLIEVNAYCIAIVLLLVQHMPLHDFSLTESC